MSHGLHHLFNTLVVATVVAFGFAVPLSVRTQYRASIAGRSGKRLLLWWRKIWDNETVFTVAVVGLGLLPVAVVLFAPLLLR
jgi:hypothetical protein